MTSWLPDLSTSGPWAWALPAAVAVSALAVTVWLLSRLRKSAWLSGIGPQAVVALGGVAVSVHGLWGFATETAGLPSPLAVAFIAVFDAAEMTLLVMMYRAADPEQGWTPELRLMHRTAWMLVSFSAAMNAVHAPNWWARPVLAAVPGLAAWLIELQLRSKLHHTRPTEDDPTGRPGPARLVALLWQHAWAALFALLGLDARTSSSAIARAALAQRAAMRVYRLRLALETKDAAVQRRSARRSRRQVERLRGRAQKALARADVATDSGQSLALGRRMAELTRVEEVARLDYSDTPAVVAFMEDLAVTPGAERLEASSLAEQAKDARQRAEDARAEAESARQRAEDALATARQELEDARREHAALLEGRQDAAGQTEAARREEAAARQRAEAARQEETAARQRAQDLMADAQQAVADEQARLDALTARVNDLDSARQARQEALQQVSDQIEEATVVRDRLRGDLAALRPQAPESVLSDDGPVWKSEAKEAGWKHYLHRLTANDHAEPTAAELSANFGVDAGNARNWLRDFRAARAAQLAAHQPRAIAAVNGTGRAGDA
ncbi:hypothetical protein [Streptomyces sp. NEAU-S77]|uniref:hypothetical protein n=1 Tax=Streptomyces sp. NEAU-S77 TaxID=3411033 RepID=UPI003BA33819